MRHISAEELRCLLDYDTKTGAFTWRERPANTRALKIWNIRFAGKIAGRVRYDGYQTIRVNGQEYLGHRLAWLHVHGSFPADRIDHVNGDPSDNRLANLRECTAQENGQNTRVYATNTSGYPGVYHHKPTGRWVAVIHHRGRGIYLGRHRSPEAAHEAYRAGKAKYHTYQPLSPADRQAAKRGS